MLDLPGHPTLDKVGLIGACSRLPVRVNAAAEGAHLICDFLPGDELLGLLTRAERDLGAPNAYVDQAMRGAH